MSCVNNQPKTVCAFKEAEKLVMNCDDDLKICEVLVCNYDPKWLLQ